MGKCQIFDWFFGIATKKELMLKLLNKLTFWIKSFYNISLFIYHLNAFCIFKKAQLCKISAYRNIGNTFRHLFFRLPCLEADHVKKRHTKQAKTGSLARFCLFIHIFPLLCQVYRLSMRSRRRNLLSALPPPLRF